MDGRVSALTGNQTSTPMSLPEIDPPRLPSKLRRTRTGFASSILVMIIALAVLPLSAGTKIVHRWVITGEPIPKVRKILVAAILENYLIRQEFEDEMDRLLAQSGVQGIKSHMVLPPRNELMEGELKQRIKESDLDAVLVIRPQAVRTETEEVAKLSTSYIPPASYYHLWPYWSMAWGQAYSTTSIAEEKTIVRAEINLYYVKDERLLWNGETDTVYSKDFGKLGRVYAKALVRQLKKDKVIGNK
jgi:hypothetical protein